MKNLLALLGLMIVVLGGVGWHQGWYTLSVSKNLDGTLRVQTDVDTIRAKQDIGQFGRKVEGFVEQHLERPTVPTSTTVPQTSPTPTTVTTAASKSQLKEGAGWLLGNVLGNPAQK